MTNYSRALGAVLCAVMLAACSGGGSVPSSSSAGSSAPVSHRRTGFIKAQVFVPRKKHQSAREVEKLKTEQRRHAHGRKPKFLSGNTTEIDFELLSVSGVTASSQDRTTFDFIVYTNGSDCTASGGGFSCTITAAAPAGSDVYDVSSRQCSQSSGTGNPCPGGDLTLLGAAVAPIAVIFDQTVAAAFTLNPVVASIAWSAVGSASYNNGSSNGAFPSTLWLTSNGSNIPTYTPSGTVGQPGTYSCAGNNCYEPAAQGTEIAYGVTLQAYDPSSALIIPASGGGTIYQTPLYLTSSGAPDVISWSCTDHVASGTSLTWATGGGPFASNSSATGANQSINSPVANPASDIDGGSTFDGNGNPVTAVGNNGTQMSWDGVDQPVLDSPDTCTATDTQSNGTTFYVGLGEGGFTGVGVTITEFSTGLTSGSFPAGIAPGSDGNVWFVEQAANQIGRIAPSGTITEFSSGLSSNAGLTAIALGPDGNLWFTECAINQIGKITTAGTVTEYSAGLTHGSQPNYIAAGPDGNLWFTEYAGRIGKITPTGTVTEYSAGLNPGSQPAGIAAGPDGDLWFTDCTGAIGKITTAGTITEYTGLASGAVPLGITAGPDGNLWFTPGLGSVGRITTAGAITEFSTGGSPYLIAAGPDGNLWYADRGSAIGEITTSGVVTRYFTGVTSGSHPWGITAGPDGNMWFTESTGNRIGRVQLPGSIDGATHAHSLRLPGKRGIIR
jgi:streptogramin lyase